jgi:hypothetical protein
MVLIKIAMSGAMIRTIFNRLTMTFVGSALIRNKPEVSMR